MPTVQTTEWDADLPDDLRTTVDNLHRSLDEFELAIITRVRTQHVQPLKDEVEEIGEEVDGVAGRLTKVEGDLLKAAGAQNTLTTRLRELGTTLAAKNHELQKTLKERLDAAERAREQAAHDAATAREELRTALQKDVERLGHDTEGRASELDQRLTDEHQRIDGLTERGSDLEADIQTLGRRVEEAAKDTDRRFTLTEQSRKQLADSIAHSLKAHFDEMTEITNTLDADRRHDSNSLRQQINAFSERLEKLQRDTYQLRVDSNTELQSLAATLMDERNEYLQRFREVRQELELRASDLESTATSLSEANVAHAELSSALRRYYRITTSLGAAALLAALVALHFLFVA